MLQFITPPLTHRAALGACLLLLSAASALAAPPFRIDWREGPAYPDLVKGGALGVLGGYVVCAGGMNYPWRESPAAYAFDPCVGQWLPLRDMPEGRVYTAGVSVGDSFFVIGGRFDGQTRGDCFKISFSPNRWTWSRIPSLNVPRGWAGVATDADLILCIGGNRFVPGEPMCSEQSTVSTVEGFRLTDPIRGWFTLPPLPGHSRGWLATAYARGRFFVFGGVYLEVAGDTRSNIRVAEACSLTPATQEWFRLADLPTPLSGAAAVTYQDRYIIILGGCAGPAREVFDSRLGRTVGEYNDVVWVYDLETDTYAALDERLPHGVNDLRAAIAGDTIYLLGGENVDQETSNTTNHFQIGTIVPVTSGAPASAPNE